MFQCDPLNTIAPSTVAATLKLNSRSASLATCACHDVETSCCPHHARQMLREPTSVYSVWNATWGSKRTTKEHHNTPRSERHAQKGYQTDSHHVARLGLPQPAKGTVRWVSWRSVTQAAGVPSSLTHWEPCSAHGGPSPFGSSPASCSNSATTP